MRSIRVMLVIGGLAWPGLPAAEVSFNREVRPILADKCFECHGPGAEGKPKGELRLDLQELALTGGDSGRPAIVPGRGGESELMRRLLSDDPDEKMPPPDFHAQISGQEIATLQRWIDQGAEYEIHWAFQVPAKKDLPPVGESGSGNPVDRWVEARLKEQGRGVKARADDEVLVRRLHFAITGLPPGWEEICAFVENKDPAKVEKLVDRLLASPHFGERMTLDWMDAARYADTHGYSRDGTRHVWLWRDWCIKAFNDNKSYDSFLLEQLAGDLLPDRTDGQLIATGYNRLHPITQEGGTIPEENLVNYVADRVKTVGESVLGLTMDCSRCHDHKYDPVSQREYFRFYAFFNTLDDKGISGLEGKNAPPVHRCRSPLRSDAELQELKQREQRVKARYEADLPEPRRKWERKLAAYDRERGKGFEALRLEPLTSTTPNGSSKIVLGDDGVVTLKPKPPKPLNIAFRVPDGLERVTGLRLRALPVEGSKTGIDGKDFGIKSLSASFAGVPAATVDLNALAEFSQASASSTADWAGAPPRNALQTTKGWRANAAPGEEARLGGTLSAPVDLREIRYATLELIWVNPPAKFVVEVFDGLDPDPVHPAAVLAAIGKPEAERTPDQQTAVVAHFNRVSPAKAALRFQLENIRQRIAFHQNEHETMVMNTAPKPRQTRLLDRGLYSAPVGDPLTPGVPEVLPVMNLSEQQEANRLDLAEWLLRGDHPLTSRVAVNRIWAMLMGRGIVASLADFGVRGSYPSHPELLDWLAVDFRESGWEVKRLVKMVVLSRVWQQDSSSTDGELEWDPLNEQLARGPRGRLQGESVRDLFLKTSGLLNEQLGGPSVNPYQPGDLWRQVSHFGSVGDPGQTFVQDHGEQLYRRSMYTFWKRTLPPPNMAVFDAPNREVCSVGREVTNTPLQALVLLNDPQFVEASRVMAVRVLQHEGGDDERLRQLFGEITAGAVSEEQMQVLREQLKTERGYFKGRPGEAKALLAVGESGSGGGGLSDAEHAAWTNVAALVFNLSQTITNY